MSRRPLIERIRVQLDSSCSSPDRQRVPDAVAATIQHATESGAVGQVDTAEDSAPLADGIPVLTVPPKCLPAPSMLARLAAAYASRGTPTVEAREIPFDSPFGGSGRRCRLGLPSSERAMLVPSAVAFRDRRLAPDGTTSEPPTSPSLPALPKTGTPFLSVVSRTLGTRLANLEEMLCCLASQTMDEFEVLLAVPDSPVLEVVERLLASFPTDFARRVQLLRVTRPGRVQPLNAALGVAQGRYVAFLDDDDLVTADWVEAFASGALEAPGAVVRCVSVNQRVERTADGDPAPYVAIGSPERVFARRFDLLEHLRDNSTPIMSFAVPRELIGLRRFCEDLPVLEDWDFLLQVALAGGVHDTDRATSIYHWWVSGESSLDQAGEALWNSTRLRVRERLDRSPITLPAGSATRLAILLEEVDLLRERLRLANQEINALKESTSWRVTAPLRLLRDHLRR